MYRIVIALSTFCASFSMTVGCGSEPIPPGPVSTTTTETIECTYTQGEGSEEITCNNGNIYNQVDNADAGPDAHANQTYYCFSYGGYPKFGAPCATADDCPASPSPCGVAVCSEGVCKPDYAAPGEDLCADDGLKCGPVGLCCGYVDLE